MEWSNFDKYNSFNSYKGLTYYENYKKIVAWMNGAEHLPPPIECNLDSIAYCQLSCYFCIVQRYLKYHRDEIGTMLKLPTDYMLRLVDFLSSWGVRGLCVSGGGEPSLHEDTPKVLLHARSKGLDTSVFTNGVAMSSELSDALLTCKWITLSIDAGDRETYKRVKGADRFQGVLDNIAQLVGRRELINSTTGIVYCFLLLPENQDSMYQACKVAKELGVQSFRVRPGDLQRLDLKNVSAPDFDVPRILEEFEKCHSLSDSDFHVFTTTHKFDENLRVKHVFKKCLATPLLIPILTDGNAYLCVDRKFEAAYKLGSCFPDPENILTWWGSDYHRDVIKSIDVGLCSRCTFGEYNGQIENVVIEDSMCLAFP